MRYTRNTVSRGSCPTCSRCANMAGGGSAARSAASACQTETVECSILPVMAFVPPQTWDCTYSCGQALERGTLFPALDKPFKGKGGCCNG